jgi:hypothetical protein
MLAQATGTAERGAALAASIMKANNLHRVNHALAQKLSHCEGDSYLGRDLYGRYVACFQCGHYLSIAEEVALWHSPPQERGGQVGGHF